MIALIRLLLFFISFSLAIVLTLLFIDWLLGHRLFIPFAKLLRFKRDDVEKTSKKVDEIFGEPIGKKTRRKKKV